MPARATPVPRGETFCDAGREVGVKGVDISHVRSGGTRPGLDGTRPRKSGSVVSDPVDSLTRKQEGGTGSEEGRGVLGVDGTGAGTRYGVV